MKKLKKRFIIPAVVFILGMCALIGAIYVVGKSQEQQNRTNAKLNAMTYTERIYGELMEGIGVTDSLKQVVISGDGNINRFYDIAANMMDDSIQSIQIAPNGVVTEIYPEESNESSKIDLINDSDRGEISRYARDNDTVIMQGPLELKQGGYGIAVRNPVYLEDENGQKMSKSKGNAVDPFDALETYGADAIRWYFYVNSAPWLPNRFHGKAVMEGQRKFMGTLWNTYAFFVLYANIDDFDATKYALEYDKLSVMDKWLLSKLNTLIKTVDNHLANYQIPEAARALQDFVDDMSNWYVRRSRERFWAKGMEQDKINAYMTLYTALVTVSKVAAPMIPFMTEEIYQNLVRSVDESAPESIHLCDYPVANEAYIDKTLEGNMDEVLKIVVMGRACRNTANIKNRQPIGKMFVKGASDLPEFYQDIVTDELNVKEIELTDDVRAFTSYTFKPQLKTVGPKYGKLLGGIKNELSSLDGNAAMDELNVTGVLKLQVNGQEIELTKEDLLIDMAQMEGYVSESDYGITVVLDTNLTEELLTEGFVREIISKIQTMRKEAGFEVMDKIKVTYDGSEKAEKVFAEYAEQIGQETLAVAVEKAEPAGYVKDWKINGEAVNMGVEKQGE